MLKKAMSIYNFFEEEKQRLKARQEYLELQESLIKLALWDSRNLEGREQEVSRELLVYNCNEEFADNTLMNMQLNNIEFEESFEKLCNNYSKTHILHDLGIENFYFNKEIVYNIVEQKIERTLLRYNIGTNLMTQEEFLRVLGSEE